MVRPMIICNTGKRIIGTLPDHHVKLVGPSVGFLGFRNAARSEHDMPKTDERFIYELRSHHNSRCSSKLSLRKTCTQVQRVPDTVEDIPPHSPLPQTAHTPTISDVIVTAHARASRGTNGIDENSLEKKFLG
jgi:hypothetical protein